MTTLPAATPTAKIRLFSIFGPRLAVTQAVWRFMSRSLPGTSDIGTWLTSCRLCEAAMVMIAKGRMATRKPMNRITWVKKFRMGVRSTMVASTVMDAPLDKAELENGKEHDQEHQNDALGGGAGVVEATEAVEI